MTEKDKNLIAALRTTKSRSRRVLFDAAADRLEELLDQNGHLREATKMVPQWVSVDEKLPEPLVRVGGIVKDSPFSQYVPEVVHLDRHGWVFSYARRYVTNVTHWMPLPSTEEVE